MKKRKEVALAMQRAKKMFIPLFIACLLMGIMVLCGCSAPPEESAPEPSKEIPGNEQDEITGETTEEENGSESGEEEKESVEEVESSLMLTYLGQSAFLLENDVSLLMDPYQPNCGTYGKIDLSVDIVTVTHEHSDHNYAQGGGENAVVLKGLTPAGDWQEVDYELEDFHIYTVENTYHGRNLGKNSIFVVETPHLRLAHLGDLGHTLDEKALTEIGDVDILIIPVGGYYTLSPQEALEVIAQLSPAVAIPAHYRTSHNSDTPIGTLEDFLALDISYKVESKGSTLQLTSRDLPQQTEIWTMDYELP